MKRFLLIFMGILLLNFTGCGTSSKEAQDLLEHRLKLVGIPQNIVATICQDDNDNELCDVGELQAKVQVNKGDSISEMWRKVKFDAQGRYILENYDPTKNIIMELEDKENLQYDNHKLSLKYNPDTEELSILQALIDADLLKEEDTQALKGLKERENIDTVLLDSLRVNQNLLKAEKLSKENALSINLEEIAKGLISLDISKDLPAQLDGCNGNQECIDTVINNTTDEVKLTPAKARELAQSRKLVDGYILKLTSPVLATCSNGNEYRSKLEVGKQGVVTFETLPVGIDCTLTVPRGATIDSNNNEKIDNSDTKLSFDMMAPADTTYITPLTTLLVKKRLLGENVDTFLRMIQNFDPVSAPTRVLNNSGIEKLKIEKLIVLMEVLKTSMKQFAPIEKIDLSDIVHTNSNDSIASFNINKLIAGLPENIQRSVKERAGTIIELLKILKDLDTSKLSLNTLFISVSDGGKSIADAIREALFVSIPSNVNPLDFIIKTETSTTSDHSTSQVEDIKERLEVINTPPVAKVSESESVEFGQTVIVDGSKSVDPDGTIVSYTWILDDKTVGAGFSFSFKDLDEGEHEITLVVKDDKGAISSDKTIITVNPLPYLEDNSEPLIVNKLPISNAGINQIVEEGTTVELDGSGSLDEDGEITSYKWTENDIVIGTEAKISHNFNVGEHLVILTVTDDKNATMQDRVSIRVQVTPNLDVGQVVISRIFANAGVDQVVKQGESFTLSGIYSAGSIDSYSWKIAESESAPISFEKSFTHSITSVGKHYFDLTITGNNVEPSTDRVMVEVLNILPVADINVSETTVDYGISIDFNGSNSYDTHGYIYSYEWRDGDEILSNDASFTESNLSVGEHTITLTVTDDHGARDTTSVHVTVQEIFVDGVIIGVIKDFNTGENLSDINISLTTVDQSPLEHTLSDENGTYMFNHLNTDINYSISFEKDGYMIVLYELIHLEENEVKTLEAIRLLVDSNESEESNISVSGTIINAVLGDYLEDVNISIRANVQNRTGTVLAETTTDSAGSYSLDLPYGIYTVEASKEGFTTSYFTITVANSEQSSLGSTSLSPLVADNEMRIILRWGATPSDLDSHLVRKTNGSEDYHIYFSNREGIDADLDRDDTSSYGPETTTIRDLSTQSVYTYYIHDFSGNSTSDLKNSNARIEVISKDVHRFFNVPNEEGMYWKVFEIVEGEIVACVKDCLQDTANENILRKVNSSQSSESDLFRNLPSK